MKRTVSFVIAVAFCCVALAATLLFVNSRDNADEQHRSRCPEFNAFDEDCN